MKRSEEEENLFELESGGYLTSDCDTVSPNTSKDSGDSKSIDKKSISEQRYVGTPYRADVEKPKLESTFQLDEEGYIKVDTEKPKSEGADSDEATTKLIVNADVEKPKLESTLQLDEEGNLKVDTEKPKSEGADSDEATSKLIVKVDVEKQNLLDKVDIENVYLEIYSYHTCFVTW